MRSNWTGNRIGPGRFQARAGVVSGRLHFPDYFFSQDILMKNVGVSRILKKALLAVLSVLLLSAPLALQAQYGYSTNSDGSVYTYNTNADGSANIARYTGPP